MIIKKIELKNFYRYGPCSQFLDLTGTGITGIVGPNGFGKSTCIVDSLCFALYGKYRCPSIDDVVNRYIGKDCKVGVEFESDGKTYKVIRYRKHSTHNNNVYIFENDKDISCHTAAETNNKIIDIIKMPYIAFTNSSVFSSELYSAFLANKVSDRLTVFENILSLKEITLFYTEIKSILKDLNEKKDEIETNKIATEREKETLNSNIEMYSNNARSKLLEMKKQKDAAKKDIEVANAKIEELSIINIDEEKAKLSNNSLKEEYNKNLIRIKKEIEELTVRENPDDLLIVEKYKDLDFEDNKNKELKYKEDLETIKARENGYTLSLEKLNSLKSEYENLKNKHIIDNKKLSDLSENLFKLKQAACPYCGQHLTSEKAEAEITKTEKQLKELGNEIKDDINTLERLENEIDKENENYNWLIKDANRIKDSLNKNFIPNTDLVFEQYSNALKRINEIEKKQKEVEKIIEELEEYNDDIKHYEFLADCFSNKAGGFKKYFIGEMIDVFNTKINQYLPFFFEEDVKITFDKNLNETIKMDEFEVGFSSFSQGQRQRAELAINFALFDVARIFFSNDNKLLILDEMDKGLDKFGIKAMINLLKGFDKQLKIFIVSHNPLMDEEIDTKIKISRDTNGFSVLG